MAQRINRIGADSYVIKVDNGGSIELDVGPAGSVTVTGDLAVQGESTSIGSSDLIIEDNTLTVNSGETGNGVTLNTAGLIIDRGIANDAYFFWDERVNSISGGISRQGSWILQESTGAINGLVASSIKADTLGKYNLNVTVAGGGPTGQVEAIRLGISRALCTVDEEYRSALKPEGLLTRDPRMVERKKFGQKKARKKFQFSKR